MTADLRILIVDDERSMQEFLEIFFRSEGYDVEVAGDVGTAIAHLEADDFDAVISDMQMPDGSGLDVLHAVQGACPDTIVIMITAFASTETAIAAMKDGAYDYITKPFKVDEIRVVLDKALEKKALSRENRRLRSELQGQARDRSIIGNSVAMQRVFDLITRVADTRANVLITGESGTGKEMVARSLHGSSERRDEAFVAVNCAAIPENLLESELFGHVKGAFTGAVQNKEGLFELAHKGTLFLDEIGDLSLPLQVKLLRVLQDKTVRRVGGTTDQIIDVRLLSATNARLEEQVANGRFRDDLYYRLNVIEIPLPPLRERTDDIPLLVRHFVEKYEAELDKHIEGASDEVMSRLLAYPFPGNVRELENVIERAVALVQGTLIEPDVLPPSLLTPIAAPNDVERIPPEGVDLDGMIDRYESGLLVEALGKTGGVKKRAAKLLGITFRSLRYRIEKLGLEADGSED